MKDARKFVVLMSMLPLMAVGNVFAQDFCPTDLTSPVKGTVGYTFLTDYMWRGLNMTSFLADGTGKGAHQMTYGLSLDLADVGVDDVGTLGLTLTEAYFNSYAGTGRSRAFSDWGLTLSRACPWTGGNWQLGYSNYRWIGAPGHDRSQEMSLAYAFADGAMWEALTGTDMGENVLNPVITYVIDWDMADNGGLLILGLSHPMDAGTLMEGCEGVTLTPMLTAVFDERYYGRYLDNLAGTTGTGRHDKMAYFEYGLKAAADITEMLGLTCGNLGFTTGLAYLDGVELADAKWYAHVGVAYNW
jgi:hypothetical protein